MEEPGFRQRLALRLEGHLLLRTLVLDRAFFWAFLIAVMLATGIGIALPKIWRTTPREFSRATIKVSLIDLAQAWSLSRAARRADAAGEYEKATLAWRGAVANNLGDPALHRGALIHLRDAPEAPPENVILALFSSSWLLALTGTNAADLDLSANVLEKYNLPDYALELLSASAHHHDPTMAPVRARCLMAAGQVSEFLSLWRTHESSWKEDARQRLYHDAWLAGWETGSPAIEAMLRLKEATRQPGNAGLTAARLLLMSAVRRGGPEDVALALNRLEQGRAASVSQHALYWRFLASVGQFDEARERARTYESRPRIAMDAAEYSQVLAALGLRDEALTYLETNLGRFQTHPAVWQSYLALLIDARRWNDVRRAAAQARIQTASFETVRILAQFAEYQAEVGQGRQTTADLLANQLGEARILDNGTALAIARTLLRDNRPTAALKVLKGKQADMRDREAYWHLVFASALGAKDLEAMQLSTQEALRLAPNNPIALSNRAAMLLAVEDRPTEALEITFRLVTEFPDSAPFRINHALALLLNHRVDEAWNILNSLDPTQLERQAASAFHLAMAETLFARGQYREALEESAKVQPGLILPPQVERLEALRRQIRDLQSRI